MVCLRYQEIVFASDLFSQDARSPLPMHIGSPDPDYFRVSGVKPTSSRWKEDWEELELLVSCLFVCLFFFQQHLLIVIVCRGKEHLGQSLKLVTRLIRESTQVSYIPSSTLAFLNGSFSEKDSSQNYAERYQDLQRSQRSKSTLPS